MSSVDCVAGIDPSLGGFGLAIWPREQPPETWQFKSRQRGTGLRARTQRYSELLEQVFGIMELYEPHTVVIEGLIVGKMPTDAKGHNIAQRGHWDRAELRGILNADIVATESIKVAHEVNPQTLKAFVYKGGATKEEMVSRVWAQWKVNCDTNDEADAVGCAAMARVVAGHAEVEDDRQQRAIDAMLGMET